MGGAAAERSRIPMKMHVVGAPDDTERHIPSSSGREHWFPHESFPPAPTKRLKPVAVAASWCVVRPSIVSASLESAADMVTAPTAPTDLVCGLPLESERQRQSASGWPTNAVSTADSAFWLWAAGTPRAGRRHIA
jgi:hypothetical protein